MKFYSGHVVPGNMLLSNIYFSLNSCFFKMFFLCVCVFINFLFILWSVFWVVVSKIKRHSSVLHLPKLHDKLLCITLPQVMAQALCKLIQFDKEISELP